MSTSINTYFTSVGQSFPIGPSISPEGVNFCLFSKNAIWVELLFFNDVADIEPSHVFRLDPAKNKTYHYWHIFIAGVKAGQLYGYRARGEWNPDAGLWFDEAKLLVDPHATQLDRRFTADIALTERGKDTAHLVPRAIVMREYEAFPRKAPLFRRGGLVYELNVRGFTMRHPDIPENQRGTVAALGHPVVVAHLKSLGVTAVELLRE